MNMVEVKTAELEGAALDWAVAVTEGLNIHCVMAGGFVVNCEEFSPSTDWAHGGPLIEKHRVWLIPPTECDPIGWDADVYEENGDEGTGVRAIQGCPTPLIAACRAIVAAKSGNTVSVPAELVTK